MGSFALLNYDFMKFHTEELKGSRHPEDEGAVSEENDQHSGLFHTGTSPRVFAFLSSLSTALQDREGQTTSDPSVATQFR